VIVEKIETIVLRASRRIGLRLSLLVGSVLLALIVVGLRPRLGHDLTAAVRSHKKAQPLQGVGSWSAPFTTDVVAIHAAVLNTGQVLMWYSDEPFGSGTGSRAELWNPVTNTLTKVQLPYTYDIFCAGMSFLQDGRLLVTGGRDDSKNGEYGIPEATLFDPATSQWSQAASMNYARWYPTNVELQDGSTLVFSGTDDSEQLVLEVESYNYQTGAWTVLPASANIPSTPLVYPRMALLPSGDVFMGGMQAQGSLFNPATNTWSNVSKLNFGIRAYGGMVLLPGLEQVLEAGGDPQEDQLGTATNTAEMIDFTQPTPAWQYVAPMNIARQNENLVLLPDGTVLAVGGGGGGGRYTNPVYQAEDYNPTTNSWTLLASQQVQRTYHSTALLLPDGRVFSGGSDNGVPATDHEIEVYSPPYLQSGSRPTITSSPSTLSYGQQFTIVTPDASSISRVALIKVESTTHATRFDARFVDLSFTIGSGQITATAPPTGNYAPPGYYYLDILNSSGVPAVMPIVAVTTSSTPTVTLSPAKVSYPAQLVNTSSAAQTVTLTDTGSAALTIGGISFAGPDASDFAQTNTCGSSLAAGAACTISITFTPLASGLRTGTLNVTDNASGSPQKVQLTGQGTVMTLVPGSLNFGSVSVGTTSASQTVTITNTGASSVSITKISVSGADPRDFILDSNTCGSTLGAAASCAVTLSFKPRATGLRTATMNVSDTGGGSPQTVALSGTGM
jgi:hypothetical protein